MNAKVKVWTSVEVNGYIFVWHHFQGEPPSWELVPVPEIANQQWAYYGRTDHTLFAHPQVRCFKKFAKNLIIFIRKFLKTLLISLICQKFTPLLF